MHWACKRGDENLAKMLAGVYRQLVNERSVSIFITNPLFWQILLLDFLLSEGM